MRARKAILLAFVLLALTGCGGEQNPQAAPASPTRAATGPTRSAEAYPLEPTAPAAPRPHYPPAGPTTPFTYTAPPPAAPCPRCPGAATPTKVLTHTGSLPTQAAPPPRATPTAAKPAEAAPTPPGPTAPTPTAEAEGACPPGFAYIDRVCWWYDPTTGDVFLKPPRSFLPPQPILLDISREKKMVLFAIIEKGRWTLYAARSDGSERRTLLGPCSPDRELRARFSPANRLAVIREFASGQLVGLYLADLEKGQTWKALRKLTGKTVEVWFAPQERWLILEVEGADELYLADIKSQSVQNMPIEPGLRRTAPLLFAPDGSRAVIQLEGERKRFYAADCRTGEMRLLLETAADDWTCTALSPDGKTLAVYIARYEKGPQGMRPLGGALYAISIETGQARLLAEGNIPSTFRFSEDGRWIHFHQDGQRRQVKCR